MHAERQLVSSSRTCNAPRRVLAALSLLVILLCSVLQATHFHQILRQGSAHSSGQWLQASGASDTDSRCPLCVSSDSALAARPAAWFRVVLSFEHPGQFHNSRLVPTEIPFSQCTRPPPSRPNEVNVFAGTAGHRHLQMRFDIAQSIYPVIRAL